MEESEFHKSDIWKHYCELPLDDRLSFMVRRVHELSIVIDSNTAEFNEWLIEIGREEIRSELRTISKGGDNDGS